MCSQEYFKIMCCAGYFNLNANQISHRIVHIGPTRGPRAWLQKPDTINDN